VLVLAAGQQLAGEPPGLRDEAGTRLHPERREHRHRRNAHGDLPGGRWAQKGPILDVAGERSNVTVQVLPFSAGASVGLEGAFTHLEFPEPIDPDVSYIEDLSGGQYVESADGNRRFRLAHERIVGQALSIEASAKLIADTVKESTSP
jgi:hypothetical protein